MSKFVWSFSALECFEQCPKKFYHKYILREKEPPTDALLRGRAIHEAIEAYLKTGAIIAPLNVDMSRFYPLVDSVKTMGAGKKLMAEIKMGLEDTLAPCGFFDKTVSGRSAADVLVLDYPNAFLADWKDGKADKPWSYVLKYEKPTQLVILSLFIFRHFPKIDKITACNIWLEHGKVGKVHTFTRSQEAALWGVIIPRIQQMERIIEINQYVTQPGPLCGYCPVTSCAHNRK